MAYLKSINPFSLELIQEYEELSGREILQKIDLSHQVFLKNRKLPVSERKKYMLNAAEILHRKKKEFATTITAEMGKPISESLAEVKKCAWVCEYYAEHAEEYLESKPIQTNHAESYVRYEPLGPVLAIMPWNFPFWQVFRFAAPNLMAGNTGLLKHASNVQGCARQIEEIFNEAGFPEGTFLNLCVGSKKVEQIINNEKVRAVTLTGSEGAGSSVAASAGKLIKKSVLELGGSNAFVVLADADIDKAVETGIKARMQNCGQSCIAAKRFIIEEPVAEEFLEKFRKKLERLVKGDPADPQTEYGPLSSVEQAELVREQVEKSLATGAELITGGKQHKAFFEPTILTGVKPGMPVFDEEVFGPVTPVMIVKDHQEALELSNNSRFGLGINVFTGSQKKAMFFVENAREGAVFINDMVKSDPRLPFGGVKKSGYGRELSLEGMREFMNIKTVFIKDLNNERAPS